MAAPVSALRFDRDARGAFRAATATRARRRSSPDISPGGRFNEDPCHAKHFALVYGETRWTMGCAVFGGRFAPW
jgi:hypothetical protein